MDPSLPRPQRPALGRLIWKTGKNEPGEGTSALDLLNSEMTPATSAYRPLLQTCHVAPSKCKGAVGSTVGMSQLPTYSQIFKTQRVTFLESLAHSQ